MDNDWTVERTITLINLYRCYPELWDSSHSNFRSREIKQIAWSIIADKCSTTSDDAEKKMKTLAAQFRRNQLKNGDGGKTTNNSSDSDLYNHLNFLKTKPVRRTTSAIDTSTGKVVATNTDLNNSIPPRTELGQNKRKAPPKPAISLKIRKDLNTNFNVVKEDDRNIGLRPRRVSIINQTLGTSVCSSSDTNYGDTDMEMDPSINRHQEQALQSQPLTQTLCNVIQDDLIDEQSNQHELLSRNSRPNSRTPIIKSLFENEFEVFGRSVGLQLQQLPVDIAIALQSDIQSMLSRNRIMVMSKMTNNRNSSNNDSLMYGMFSNNQSNASN